MTRDLVDRLQANFPDMFVNLWGDPTKTCMWEGIACGDGWYGILNRLCGELKRNNCQVQFDQIKEKYAILRVYCTVISDPNYMVHKLIEEAVNASEQTCELCGDTNQVKTTGTSYLITRCLACREMI